MALEPPEVPAAPGPGRMAQSAEMDKWLREQAERAQKQKVTTREAMCIAPVLYFGTWRTTHSDVLSIVTTITPFRRTAPSRKKWKHGKRVNLNNNPVPFKDPQYTSPLREPGEAERTEHARKNQALWMEEQMFISKLDSRRRDREDVEITAATCIQRVVRGFLMRLFLQRERKRLVAKARLKKSYMSMAYKIRLQKEMEDGLERAKMKKEEAAIYVQGYFRRFLALRACVKEKITIREEVLNMTAMRVQLLARARAAQRVVSTMRQRFYYGERSHAARRIQAVFRGILYQQRAKARLLLLKIVAATMIQRPYRRHLADKIVKKELAVRRIMLTNDASIRIQVLSPALPCPAPTHARRPLHCCASSALPCTQPPAYPAHPLCSPYPSHSVRRGRVRGGRAPADAGVALRC